MTRPVITLLTDFGVADHYVAAMKGVMLTIAPEAVFVDISHDVGAYDIWQASYVLAQAWNCFPAGTVHLVVVDPGVGSVRRPILGETDGHFFVAPDNGVLTMATVRAGKGPRVREITNDRFFRQPVSRTFHGRDIFAPSAAHLATGVDPADFGQSIEDYVRLDIPAPLRAGSAEWTGIVLRIDRFGNAITNLLWKEFAWIAEEPFLLRAGNRTISHFRRSYSDEGSDEAFLLAGSAGYLEISLNQRSAAATLGISNRAELHLTRL